VNEIKKEAENKIRIAESIVEKRVKDTDLLEHRAVRAEADIAELRELFK